MTAALTIPFYWVRHKQRGAATRKVFSHYRRVADEVGIEVFGVGSEEADSRSMWSEFFPEQNYLEYPQDWATEPDAGGSRGLRQKFDTAIQFTKQCDPDHVFILGSDDVLTAEFFRLAIKSDADLVGVGGGDEGGTRIVRLADGAVRQWKGGYGWGRDLTFCGGCLGMSRRLLDGWGWAVYEWPQDEAGVERRARSDGYTLEALYAKRDGFVCWNVKTNRVLNGWTDVLRAETTRAPQWRHEFRQFWAGL